MKNQARVVIIGGGAMGVGLLYHLTKEGWSDVMLVEKGELTSGSTWHAAGLIPNFIGGLAMAALHDVGVRLYQTLEEETGQATGWHGCGAVRLATRQDEVDWFKYVKGQLDYLGIEMHLIGPDEIKTLHPLLDTEGVILGAYTPNDGHTDPASSTNAMAKGARMGGAEISLRNRVLDAKQRPSGEWEVTTEQGTIVCEHLVNAAGSFARQIGAWVGLDLPIVNMVHQYLVTDNIPEVEALEKELPVVRDARASTYYRQEQRGLIVGPYETAGAEAWALDGVDWSFDMELLPPDIDRLTPHLESVMERMPCFANAGIKRVVNGPITHLPDGNFLLGPAPGLRNHWLCCGASIGITQGPGAGKYLAQRMVHGQADINLFGLDGRRYGSWATQKYAVEKCIDEYHHMYAIHYPGEHRDPGRPMRTTPLYGKLKDKGAVYAEVFGWERPKWFAPSGVEENYGFRRTNAFDSVAEECRAVRERVGLLDLSSFAKFEVSGRDSEALLNRLLANRMPRKDGGIALAHLLTADGRIESEMTVTRVGEGRYYLLSAAVAELRDLDLLSQGRRQGEDATVTNITEDYGVLVLTGPKSRTVLSDLTDADLDNGAFRWLTARTIAVAGVDLHALRVSYAGELGWELHAPMAQLERVYDALMETGQAHGIADFGAYALNSLRMEKAYKGWGSELTTEITMIEAGMERFVDFDKGDFVGREALLRRREEGPLLKLTYLDVEPGDADPLGNEPVYKGDRIVGVTTSGAHGHATGRSYAFAYLEPALAAPGTALEVSMLGIRRPARVLDGPAYDPKNERLRA